MCTNRDCDWRVLFIFQTIFAGVGLVVLVCFFSEIDESEYTEVKAWHMARPELRAQIVHAYANKYISRWEYRYISQAREKADEEERERKFEAQLKKLEILQLDPEEDDDGPLSTTSRSQ